MNEYRIELKLSELETGLTSLRNGIDTISQRVTMENQLWDNSDIIKNWHVSARTLAYWRSKGLITFTKVGKKIYYEKTDRDAFIRANKVNTKKLKKNESILHN